MQPVGMGQPWYGIGLDAAVVGVLDRLAGMLEERLVDLGPDAPGRALQRQGLPGGELEADELAAGGEELGHALGPSGALGGLQGA